MAATIKAKYAQTIIQAIMREYRFIPKNRRMYFLRSDCPDMCPPTQRVHDTQIIEPFAQIRKTDAQKVRIHEER